jgi:CheY-like chemotaxis protein
LPGEDILISSDATRLKEVLINLTSNAIKFTRHGGITIKLSYPEIGSMDHLTTLYFSVEDTGEGMEPEELKLLFNRFSQTLGTQSKETGFGLGLAICKEMVRSMGGKIWVDSKKNQGSKFSFTICAQAQVPTFRIRSREHSPVSSNLGVPPSLNLLVVDDNSMVRKVLVMQLPKGSIISEASQGKEAVERFLEKKFDIIFMDLRMPVMDGIQATKEIRRIEKEKNLQRTWIVGISADAREEYQMNAIESGMDDFLTKPVSREKILDIIKASYRK